MQSEINKQNTKDIETTQARPDSIMLMNLKFLFQRCEDTIFNGSFQRA